MKFVIKGSKEDVLKILERYILKYPKISLQDFLLKQFSGKDKVILN